TYGRVALRDERVEPIMISASMASGSGILSSMAKADGFVIIPDNVKGYDEGQRVEVVLFD
ncbi:MAG: molybdopterin molybdenumtransferase MoeA, partial [Halobacteriota archaeon]